MPPPTHHEYSRGWLSGTGFLSRCIFRAEICNLIGKAKESRTSLVVFPELCVTGATCGDLFRQSLLIKGAEEGVARIAEACRQTDMTVVVGAPVPYGGRLYNCSIVMTAGEIKGIVPKTYLSADEHRTFSSGNDFLEGNGRWEIHYFFTGRKNHRLPGGRRWYL